MKKNVKIDAKAHHRVKGDPLGSQNNINENLAYCDEVTKNQGVSE